MIPFSHHYYTFCVGPQLHLSYRLPVYKDHNHVTKTTVLQIPKGYIFHVIEPVYDDHILTVPRIFLCTGIVQLLLTLEVDVLAVRAHFGLILVAALGQSKAFQDSLPEPIIPPFHAVVTVIEVVIDSSNGHLVFTRLLSLSKIQAILRAFYRVCYIDDAKWWLYV